MRLLTIVFTMCFMSFAASAFADSQKPAVADVGGIIHGKEAYIHFRLENVFFPEMIEALKSGMEISFRIDVEVERVHRNWFNVKVGDLHFTQSIQHDVLSRAYRLRHPDGDEIFSDLQQALDKMTFFQVTLPLSMEIRRGKIHKASARVRFGRAGFSEPLRSMVFFFSKWDLETSWGSGPVIAP